MIMEASTSNVLKEPLLITWTDSSFSGCPQSHTLRLLCFRDLDWFWVTDNLGHLFFTSSVLFNSLFMFSPMKREPETQGHHLQPHWKQTLDLFLYPRPDLLCILLNLLVMNLVLFSSFQWLLLRTSCNQNKNHKGLIQPQHCLPIGWDQHKQ